MAVLAIPETAARRPGVLAALRPRVAVPRRARTTFAVALPCLMAAPALLGFYVALGPSLAAQVLRSPDLLWGGLVILLVAGSGAAASVALRGVGGAAAMLAGCLVLLTGVVMTLAAIQTESAAAFLAGAAVAGAGFGTGFFLGAYRILTPLVGSGQRASLIAAIWIVYYLAFSVPVVIAGVATKHVGLHQTAVVYSAALAVLLRRPRAASCSTGLRAANSAQRGCGARTEQTMDDLLDFVLEAHGALRRWPALSGYKTFGELASR